MRISRAFLFVGSAALGIYWAVERHTNVQLQQQLATINDQGEEITRLHREHDRLVGLQQAEIGTGTVRDEDHQAAPDTERYSNDQRTSLRPGTWTPAAAWKYQGQATPEAAVETMLWAATGGDLSTLKNTLALAPDTRSKAADLLASLPPAASQTYASPDDLMALLVAGNVPLDSAQVVAKQINQDGQVIEYLRLKDSDGRTRQVFLTLQKLSDSWRLTVPASALDPIAQANGSSSAP
jgi:hypothetical protein